MLLSGDSEAWRLLVLSWDQLSVRFLRVDVDGVLSSQVPLSFFATAQLFGDLLARCWSRLHPERDWFATRLILTLLTPQNLLHDCGRCRSRLVKALELLSIAIRLHNVGLLQRCLLPRFEILIRSGALEFAHDLPDKQGAYAQTLDRFENDHEHGEHDLELVEALYLPRSVSSSTCT